jgi:hypothetical protein
MLAQVAADFCRLDERAYDAEALFPVMDHLLAARCKDQTLRMAERFLPAVRKSIAEGTVFPHAEAGLCNLIFNLRAGIALRHDIRDEIDPPRARRAIHGIGPAPQFG